MDEYWVRAVQILSVFIAFLFTVSVILDKPSPHTHSSRPAYTATVPAGKCASTSTNQATKGHS